MRTCQKIISLLLPVILPLCLVFCSHTHSGTAAGESYFIDSEEELEELLAQLREPPYDTGKLAAVWWYYTRSQRYRELIAHALPLYHYADSIGDENVKAYAGTYLAQVYIPMTKYDSVHIFLDEVSDVVERKSLDNLKIIIYNTRAMYAAQAETNYAEALEHFIAALEISRQTGDITNEGVLLCNIASIYLMRRDSTGLSYAQTAYGLSKERGDEYILVSSTMLLSQLHHLVGRYEMALEYALQLAQFTEQPMYAKHKSMAHILLAEIAHNTGRNDQASYHYGEAWTHSAELDNEGTALRLYSSYGDFLLHTGRSAESRDIFLDGLALSLEKKTLEGRERILLGLSEAYISLGDKDKALEFYRNYHSYTDSMRNLQREQSFNRLLMRYETLNHEKELNEKELNLIKANRKIQLTVYILIVVTVVSGSIFILYWRKNRMYRQLVEKHQKFLALEHGRQAEKKERNDSVDNTEAKLFETIEELMDSGHIYRHNDISLEKIAEMTHSNRFTVSRVINRFSGMSFYNYINSYRMREAVAILSDPGNDIPLKALYVELGYNALSAFYRSFQKETGVPPSKYREEVRRMRRSKQ